MPIVEEDSDDTNNTTSQEIEDWVNISQTIALRIGSVEFPTWNTGGNTEIEDWVWGAPAIYVRKSQSSNENIPSAAIQCLHADDTGDAAAVAVAATVNASSSAVGHCAHGGSAANCPAEVKSTLKTSPVNGPAAEKGLDTPQEWSLDRDAAANSCASMRDVAAPILPSPESNAFDLRRSPGQHFQTIFALGQPGLGPRSVDYSLVAGFREGGQPNLGSESAIQPLPAGLTGLGQHNPGHETVDQAPADGLAATLNDLQANVI